LDIEELTEEELSEIKKRYARLAKEAIIQVRKGKTDTGRPRL
jgi:hypothetical protein